MSDDLVERWKEEADKLELSPARLADIGDQMADCIEAAEAKLAEAEKQRDAANDAFLVLNDDYDALKAQLAEVTAERDCIIANLVGIRGPDWSANLRALQNLVDNAPDRARKIQAVVEAAKEVAYQIEGQIFGESVDDLIAAVQALKESEE